MTNRVFVLPVVTFLIFQASVGRAQIKRQVPFSPGVAISRLIEPTDRSIEILREEPLKGFFPGDIPPADLIRAHALDAEAILVVRVDTVNPYLTPRADWIRTSYQAAVIEQLRPKGRRVSQTVRIDQDGGTLLINGVTATANAESEPRFEAGGRYLLFAHKMRDPLSGIWAYKIGDNRLLASTWNAFYEHGAADSIHGMPFDAARKLILTLER